MTSFRMRPRRSSTATRQSPSISTASGDEDLLDGSSPSRIPYQHARSSQPLQRLWLGALAAARYTRRAAARTQRGAEDRTAVSLRTCVARKGDSQRGRNSSSCPACTMPLIFSHLERISSFAPCTST